MKLDGLRVLDLSMYLPGPHLSMMMADNGAEVINIEAPGGEPTRHLGPFQDGHSVWFRNLNRGKKSLCLNLKTDEGREILQKLSATADVFVEGFRPGVVDRLGIGYDALKAVNPKLIYCSLSAFGQTGPLAKKAAHDMGPQALAGTLAINDGADGNPVVPGLPAADIGVSMMGLIGILMALHRRAATGKGEYVDAAMYDTLLSWTGHLSGPTLAYGIAPQTRTGRSIGGAAFYNVYPTADGRHVVLTGREMKNVRNLLMALDREDLIDLYAQDDCVAQEPVKAFLTETFGSKPLDHWAAFVSEDEVGHAPVLSLPEALEQPQVAARDMLLQETDLVRHMGLPLKFTEEPGQVNFHVAALGEDADDLLAELGYDSTSVASFRGNGVLG